MPPNLWSHQYRTRRHRPEEAARRFVRDHWGGGHELYNLVGIRLACGSYHGLFQLKSSGPPVSLPDPVVWLLAHDGYGLWTVWETRSW